MPGTTWLGQGNPIFGGADAAPRYTGPLNFNMGSGPFAQIMQAAGPAVLQQLMAGTGRNPFQFFPAQSIHDQMIANQHFINQQQAMAIASRRDQAQIAATLNGAGRMWEGRELTQAELARNATTAGMFSQYLPLAVQIFGPDLIDQAHGARGSSTIMGQQLHAAMRTAVDPLTGRVGMSGQSAGMLSQEIYSQLFGQNANLAAMRGMSAGQAGLLANELQSRGMLGNLGQLGPNVMTGIRARGAGFYDDAFIARAADRDPAIQAIRDRGATPTAADYDNARNRIRETRDRALSPGSGGLTMNSLEQLAGGADILRAGDAHAISQRLESLSGVVSAMREIFGDMGNPNAPMHEIISGLQNLTQGGLSQISPGELENMVRRTHAIARQTGVGMQGMVALTTQAGAFGDQLGLHRSLAVGAANQSALFGASARATQRLDRPGWNSLDLDQLTLADLRMRQLGAASPLGNNLNAMLRLADTGIIPAAGDAPTEAQAIVAAIRRGGTTYEWGGQTRSLQMNRDQLQQIITRDHGVASGVVGSIFNDRAGNQQYGNQTQSLMRELQVGDATRALGGAFAAPLTEQLASGAGLQALQAAGVAQTPEQARAFAGALGTGTAADFFGMSGDTVSDPTQFRAAGIDALRRRIRQQVIASGVPAANVDAATERVIAGLGGEAGLGAFHEAMIASGNRTFEGTLYRSTRGAHQLFSTQTLEEMRRHSGQAETTRMLAGALGGIGSTPPLARLVDVLSQARPGQDLRGMMADALGGIDPAQISAADPHGIVSAMTDLVAASSSLNANNPADRPFLDRNNILIRGLSMGGQAAQSALDQYEYDASISGPTIAALTAAARGGGGASILNSVPTGPDAGSVATRLIESLPFAQQMSPELANPWSRARLINEINRGARGGAINTALRSQDQLVNMALAHGLYGTGTTSDELTPEQRLQAGSLLQGARNGGGFNAREQQDLDMWTQQARPLQTLGQGGTERAVDDAVRVIRGFGGAAAAPGIAGATPAGQQITQWQGTFELIGNTAVVNARPADTVGNLVG